MVIWNNAQFQADLAAIGFARADLVEAGLIRNPVLSLLFTLGPKQLEATLNLPIDFLLQRPKRISAAKLDAEIVADNLIQHGLNLTRDVLLAYTDLVLSRQHADIFKLEAELQKEAAEIARKAYNLALSLNLKQLAEDIKKRLDTFESLH